MFHNHMASSVSSEHVPIIGVGSQMYIDGGLAMIVVYFTRTRKDLRGGESPMVRKNSDF
jgi:hypothetical protein